jgi:hypothetical protein
MAVSGIKIGIEFPELERLRQGIKNLGDKKFASTILAEALEKAIYPAFLRLGEVTPIGPTRNLRRAVSYKVKPYPRTGNAVALIGYARAGDGGSVSAQGGTVRAGPDRAFHQWWLEFGTKQRIISKFSNKPYQRKSPTAPFTRIRNGKEETVRGSGAVHWVSGQNAYIASSFNRLGPFKFVKVAGDRKRVQTDPPYNRAFFRKSKTPIIIDPVLPGGVAGRPPVQTAWNQTKSLVAERLTRELQISLEAAIQALTFSGRGSITGALTQEG